MPLPTRFLPPPGFRRDRTVDTVLAVALFGALAAGLWFYPPEFGEHYEFGWAAYILGALLTLPLAWRRRAPSTVGAIVLVAMVGFRVLQAGEVIVSSISWFLAYYGVGAFGTGRTRHVLRGVNIAAFAGLYVFTWVLIAGDPELVALLPLVRVMMALDAGLLLAGWVMGERSRAARVRTQELAQRTAELEIERERNAQQAVTAERLRIAREFHDVLGHHVSVIGIQAAGARRVLQTDPRRAEQALEVIEQASRQAVTEMQRALALLREEDDPAPRRSAPLSSVEDVIDDLRVAGLTITTQIDVPERLPSSVGLAATRIVQEALTNTLRHAGADASAWVRIARRDGELEVEVADDGRGQRHEPCIMGGGRGLVGLRERVELHQGTFHAGPRPGGGFLVRAHLPLEERLREQATEAVTS